MGLGGGIFTTQNKVLPGAYINFVSAAKASATLSERGIATMPLELDWGIDGEVFEVTNADFQKESLRIFGYDYTHEKMKGLRDLFESIKTLYAYKLTSGGTKAACAFATALYAGVRGNDIKIVIKTSVDDETMFDVSTLIDNTTVDTQTVTTSAELKDNDFVTFDSETPLTLTASTPLEGGVNGEITGSSHQNYIEKIENYIFNTLGVDTTDETVKGLYKAFNKRMRDEMGIKFQLVLHKCEADYYGTINVDNDVNEEGWKKSALVYWVTGITAGCDVNKSNLNKVYSGGFTVKAEYTQNQLKKNIEEGKFTLHKVGDDLRVLDDINSMVTTSDTQGDIFKDNQTVRIVDQIANDIAVIFNTKYLGTVPNDNAGRMAFWSDIVQHHQQMNDIRAIENFADSDVTVSQGDSKKSVIVDDAITVINTMAKLYMTVTVQ